MTINAYPLQWPEGWKRTAPADRKAAKFNKAGTARVPGGWRPRADLTMADALAEGIVQLRDGGFGLPAGEHYHATDPRISYWSLWDHINGPGSVEANPWVWAIEWPALPNTAIQRPSGPLE